MAKQLNEPLPDPRKRNENLSLNFVMMLQKKTKKGRSERYQTPTELLAAIENCQSRLAERFAQEKEDGEKKTRRGFFR